MIGFGSYEYRNIGDKVKHYIPDTKPASQHKYAGNFQEYILVNNTRKQILTTKSEEKLIQYIIALIQNRLEVHNSRKVHIWSIFDEISFEYEINMFGERIIPLQTELLDFELIDKLVKTNTFPENFVSTLLRSVGVKEVYNPKLLTDDQKSKVGSIFIVGDGRGSYCKDLGQRDSYCVFNGTLEYVNYGIYPEWSKVLKDFSNRYAIAKWNVEFG